MTRICPILLVVLFSTLTFAGEGEGEGVGEETKTDWRQLVIPNKERTFDFKTVAKGTTPEHEFVLTNLLQEPIRIGEITSSCTCTTLHFDAAKTVINTYEKFVLTARLRGDQFVGQRNATITVVIDKPIPAEMQFNIKGEIRTDLSISPQNFIDFKNVELGKEQTRPLTVAYTGSNAQWRIVDAKCDNEFIHAEISSESFVGRREFKINVSIDKSAPNGLINTHLVLISNDTEIRREIPISIRAKVGTVIQVVPASLYLGALSPGEASPQKNVVLRGTKPFRILKIECDNPAIDIPLKIDANAPPKELYPVLVLYKNPAQGAGSPEEGVMRALVRVTTDIPDLAPAFYVTASVLGKEDEE